MPSRNPGGSARFAGLSSQEVDRLLALGDGAAALVYMYVRRNGQCKPDAVPGLDASGLRTALRRLNDAGLLTDPNSGFDRPCDTIASKTALTRPAFTMVLAEAERLLGRVLSPEDMRTLYDIFDFRGLPPGVILLLLHYCVDEVKRRHGETARPPGIRQIDREAAIWQQEGLQSEEQAEQYISQKEKTRSLSAKSLKSLGIFGRPPSETEKKYVQSWIEMGFEPDAIAVAYDITVLKTGKLQWKYCDSILRRWHEEGLHSRADVEARQQKTKREPGQQGSGPRPSPEPPAQDNAGLAQTRRALERVKEHARKTADSG